MNSLLGKKIDQTQGFLEDGTRVPLSVISVAGNVVTQLKTGEKEGYNSIQIGFGEKKQPTKAISGHTKKAGLDKSPRFFREIRVDDIPSAELGSTLNSAEILEPGDIVDISGVSKGKGFAGVIKRHHFHGGPKTHGQSDRERAPGAIGQGTTPGRVYKGKKMPGNMGNDNVTVKNLLVLKTDGDNLLVKGLIPGVRGGIVTIKKVGTNKKFTPLWAEKQEELQKEAIQAETVEETKSEELQEESKAANSAESSVVPTEESSSKADSGTESDSDSQEATGQKVESSETSMQEEQKPKTVEVSSEATQKEESANEEKEEEE